MKKTILTLLVAILALGCTREPSGPPERPRNPYGNIDEKMFEKGILRIKLKPEAADAVALDATRNGLPATGIAELDRALENIGATTIYPTFYEGGRNAAMHRKAGLHLWYTVRFDEERPLTRAIGDVYDLAAIVDIVEPAYPISFAAEPECVFTAVQLQEMLRQGGYVRSSDIFPYNDILLDAQWHYYNDGSLPVSKPGADANIFPAWRLETGKPEIIVAVVDGGIDYNHEDLEGAVWINEAELTGTAGTDDDGNDFTDDVYGWNFYNDSPAIAPIRHATHIAGTIAARNDNGKGVCGIAGGDGSPGTGVKVMCCQCFMETNLPGTDEQIANAIVYGADNGAVISSNSWNYSYWQSNLSELHRSAIDYFIMRAGMDTTGSIQTGPMAGGVVIFSAGNDNLGVAIQPGAYTPVVAVANMASNYKKAKSSNFGTWVNLSAPGGDQTFNTLPGQAVHSVLSTLPGNTYGYMQGTSMAVPHVSGIAALVVSRFGGAGFTAEMLKDRLYNAVNNIDIHNSDHVGMLGLGYIDAFKALRSNRNVPPDPVTDFAAAWDHRDASLSWTVTCDQNMSPPVRYDILVARQSLAGVDFDDPPIWARPISVATGSGTRVGSPMLQAVENLTENTVYHVAITAVDFYGLRSAPATIQGRTTEKPVNKPPVISNIPQDVELAWNAQRSYQLMVTDPEGDTWSYEFTPGSPAATVQRTGGGIRLSFDAQTAGPGSYSCTVAVTDIAGNTARAMIDYHILDPQAPQLVKDFRDLSFDARGRETTINLSDYFRDPAGSPLAINVQVSVRGVVNYELRIGNSLWISSRNNGSCRFRVTAANELGMHANGYFNVTCDFKEEPEPPEPPGDGDFALYPNPVHDILNIAINGITDPVSVRVEIYNASGVQALHTVTTVAPSAPGKVDVSGLRAGSYNIVLTTHENRKYSQTMVKI